MAVSAEARKAIVLEVLDGVLRSWWTVIAGICLGLTVAVTALHYLPKTYQTRTVIYVAPNVTSRTRAAAPDDMRPRIRTLRERVLSRQYLTKIIDEHYEMPPTDRERDLLMESIKSRVNVDVRQGSTTFFLQFADNDPQRCAGVTNDLAQLFIDENTTYRIEVAQGKLELLEELEAEALAELNALDDRISEFKSKHAQELAAGNQGSAIRILEGRRTSYEVNKPSIAAARERLRSLESQLAQELESDIGEGGTGARGETSPLQELRAELRDLRNRYSDEHPSVKAKKREIEEYLANRSSDEEDEFEEDLPPPTSPVITNLNDSIRDVKSEITRLEAEQTRLENEIKMYEARIEAAPVVENELNDLTKGHRVLSDQYEGLKTQMEASRQALALEEKQEGEQFEVIEPAVAPTIPSKPNPMMLIAMGVGVGLILFVGPVVAKKLLAPTVDSEAGLTAVSEVPILVSIPRVQTDDLARAAWRRKVANVGLAAASVAILAVMMFTLSLQ
jgi:polysaccharide chain length determinant protein (PEP-CTERM system associated)